MEENGEGIKNITVLNNFAETCERAKVEIGLGQEVDPVLICEFVQLTRIDEGLGIHELVYGVITHFFDVSD